MSKELEEFEEMYNWIYCNTGTTYEDDVKLDKIRKNVKSALQRLESIDNANPSEALECLERFFNSRKIYEPNNTFVFDCITRLNSIKQALIKAQEQEKVLEIIFKKTVGIFQLSCCKNVYEYNDLKFNDNEKLTEEEFDLLKRWLG